MLPGFRILFALVILSCAILIFGFGALALLRIAHENLASQPTWQPAWRTPVEIANARRDDRPSSKTQTLALLRVDPPSPPPSTDTTSPGVVLADAPPAPSPVPVQHGEATPTNAIAEATSRQLAEAPAAATANIDDRPIPPAPAEPIAGAGDRTSEQAITSLPANDAPKLSASNASGAPEAAQGSSPSGPAPASEPVASDSDSKAQRANTAEAASEIAKADPSAPKSELTIKLAALPDAATSSGEAGQQAEQLQSADKPDAAEIRARRRAHARLRARRLAMARARAALFAQQRQATANPPFYGSNFSATQNANSPAYSPPNATPFGLPRGAP